MLDMLRLDPCPDRQVIMENGVICKNMPTG